MNYTGIIKNVSTNKCIDSVSTIAECDPDSHSQTWEYSKNRLLKSASSDKCFTTNLQFETCSDAQTGWIYNNQYGLWSPINDQSVALTLNDDNTVALTPITVGSNMQQFAYANFTPNYWVDKPDNNTWGDQVAIQNLATGQYIVNINFEDNPGSSGMYYNPDDGHFRYADIENNYCMTAANDSLNPKPESFDDNPTSDDLGDPAIGISKSKCEFNNPFQTWIYDKKNQFIQLAADPTKCLQVGFSSPIIGDCNLQDMGCAFSLTPLKKGPLPERGQFLPNEITNIKNKRCLDCNTFWDCNDTPGQQWIMTQDTNYLQNNNGDCLSTDPTGQLIIDNNNCKIWNYDPYLGTLKTEGKCLDALRTAIATCDGKDTQIFNMGKLQPSSILPPFILIQHIKSGKYITREGKLDLTGDQFQYTIDFKLKSGNNCLSRNGMEPCGFDQVDQMWNYNNALNLLTLRNDQLFCLDVDQDEKIITRKINASDSQQWKLINVTTSNFAALKPEDSKILDTQIMIMLLLLIIIVSVFIKIICSNHVKNNIYFKKE